MIKPKKNIILFSPSIEDGGVEKNLEYLSKYFLEKKKKKLALFQQIMIKKIIFLNVLTLYL